GTLGVVEAKVVTEAGLGFPAILICFQVNFFVFHRIDHSLILEIKPEAGPVLGYPAHNSASYR
ncbi:MAG: hypothetical protein QGI79_06760, partial [Dehalococcoidia bacterium]|nr:hypothetical protein [Dehalococcoidia bacterium]